MIVAKEAEDMDVVVVKEGDLEEVMVIADAGQQWRNRINGKRDKNKQNKP